MAMADLPFFLRERNMFTDAERSDGSSSSSENNNNVNESAPGRSESLTADSTRGHDVTTAGQRHHQHGSRRSFELSVNLEALLEIKDAAELLFGFLVPVRDEKEATRIWLSDDIYIVNRDFENGIDEYVIFELLDDPTLEFFICHVQPTAAEAEPSRPTDLSSALLYHVPMSVVVDTCLCLLAKLKSIKNIDIDQHEATEELFPASVDALKMFVSAASSRRLLCFKDNLRLTIDQCRAVTFNCNENVSLECSISNETLHRSFLQALIDAMKCHQCPAKLILFIEEMPTDMFPEFVAAVKVTTTLKKLHIIGLIGNVAMLILLCGAIAENHGLLSLKLRRCKFGRQNSLPLSDSQWDFICRAILTHPTLKTIIWDAYLPESSRSLERDQTMIQCISVNPVLCRFKAVRAGFADDWDVVNRAFHRVLDLNRVRPVVESIKQETDSTHRQRLFTSALLSHYVSKRAACRFWLLKENADLLAEFSSWPGNVVSARWHRAYEQLVHANEEEMLNWQMQPPPPLESLVLGKRRRQH